MKKHFALLLFVLAATPAAANVLDVSSATVTKGKAQIKLGAFAERDAAMADAYEYEIEGEYAPTGWWRTGVEAAYTRTGDNAVRYSDTTLKNTFQFMRQGEDALSAALRVDYRIANTSADADRAALRLIGQRSFGTVAVLGNLIAKREVGEQADGETKAEARAALRYTYNEWFRPSVEYMGDAGSLNHPVAYRSQNHRLGPVAYFTLTKQAGVELGYFAGISENAPDNTFKINVALSLN